MRCVAVRHCAGKMTDNGCETSAPPSSEPNSEPVTSPDRDADEFIMPVDLDVLIDQIKSHPVLYKTAQAEYRERTEKEMVWAEICSHLFKRWCEYSPQKKRDRIREVQKKWRNMMDDYFDFTCQLSPVQKKRKTIFDRMSFLGESTVADDVDMGAYRINNNNNNNNEEFAPILDPITTPQAEMPNLTMPSTSAQVEDFSNNYEVKKMPIFVPTANIPSQTEPSNPNLYFSLMLVPLLNRLSQDKLYAVWPKILKIIEETEGPSKLQILQQELIYPPGVQPATLADPDPEPAEEEGPVYSCSHGRPKNKDGEIMYPETDHEDLDDV